MGRSLKSTQDLAGIIHIGDVVILERKAGGRDRQRGPATIMPLHLNVPAEALYRPFKIRVKIHKFLPGHDSSSSGFAGRKLTTSILGRARYASVSFCI